MRLEYKIGVVIGLVIIVSGVWFFVTRDKGSGGPATAENTQVAPRGPAATPATGNRTTPPGPITARPDNSLTPRSGNSLDPGRSPLPGIRSETPLAPTGSTAMSSSPRPLDTDLPRRTDIVPSPTTRPSFSLPLAGGPSTTAPAAGRTAPPLPLPPAVASVLESAPPAESVRTHVVKSGETIAGLARKYYGSERFTAMILNANKQYNDPRRIPVGARLIIPPAPEASSPTIAAPNAVPAGARTGSGTTAEVPPVRQPANTKPYTVKAGDTWRGIAARTMGSESRYLELFEMNKRTALETVQSRILRPGEIIYVPVSAAEPASASKAPSASRTTLIGTK